MTVAKAGEFGLIARITRRLPAGPSTLLGPGDDAALVAAPDRRVVVSTDVLVDGRHFRRDWSTAEDVGHRAAAANLADIAAMGATPTALVVALCTPPDLLLNWAEELADGLGAEAASAGAAVVGGDISSSPTLTIAVTALGDLDGRPPVTRGGARPGDVVAVAGRLGHAAAGYTVLCRGFRTPKILVDAHRRPEVPYRAGPEAARLGATAMIDVSDGLLADLGHVAAASGVAIDLRRDTFPLPGQMRDAAAALGVDPYTWLLSGGDDHALAATFPAGTELPDGWLVVGQVQEAETAGLSPREATGTVGLSPREATGAPLVTVDGRAFGDGPGGWDHFR